MQIVWSRGLVLDSPVPPVRSPLPGEDGVDADPGGLDTRAGYPASAALRSATPGPGDGGGVGAASATPDVPQPTAAPAEPIHASGFEAIVCSEPWPCGEAIAVAACESGTDANGRLDGNWATNGGNYGLYQINAIHAGNWPDFWENWMNPERNAEWAFELWSHEGWAPWGACAPAEAFSERAP
jgi:Lysozyme like domain